MGCRQAKGCEVKQICGRLSRNHKGTRRRLPLSWCSIIHPNQFQVVKFQQNFKVPKNDRSFYYLKNLGSTYQLSNSTHLGKVHGFIIFRILWGGWNSWSRNWLKHMEGCEGYGVFMYIPTKEVCLDISIFLWGRNLYISFCFASWLLFGECTQRK